MKKIHRIVILILLLCLVLPLPASAQQEELTLRLSRDFGYSSGTGDIQGTFSARVTGPENLQRVIFYLDDEVLGEVNAEPFRLRFTTDNYELGVHSLQAVGYTMDGVELRSQEIRANFVSAEEGWQAAGRIAGPILALAVVAMLLGLVVPILSGRKKKPVPLGAEQRYGAAGGAICPRCERPFPMSFMAMNLGPFVKLDRCPHCGKWGAMRRRSLQDLRNAEAAELQRAQTGENGIEMLSEEEKLRRELEQSRYHDI